ILVEQETMANQDKTHFLARLLWPRFEPHIIWSKDQDVKSLRAAPAVSEIDKIVVDLFQGTNILKAKLYNIDGLTVYSSQHSQIGENKSDNPGFISASNGSVRSNLTWRNEFHAFEKVAIERDIVSSYLPLYDTNAREVIAVVELYSDVTDLLTHINHTRNQVVFGALTCFGLLLGALYVLMVRADLLITRQHKALDNANKEISRLAYRDAVTQLPNRHRFDQVLEEKVNHCRRNDEGFSLFYLDLDGFKAINDSYGHSTGDVILTETAQRLKLAVRSTDMVFRIGGDEFALLLSDVNTPEAVTQFTEKLLIKIAEPIEIGEHIHSVSASIGIACYPESASNAKLLIELADSAMYRAKSRGKNCYETSQI
ncbi:MAG: GGDEF domain-containing protein, partial [Gammaproteobacteria bacterium]|nr:GGDEF domain-containing protein [Gammaproteobacteria bacterium]